MSTASDVDTPKRAKKEASLTVRLTRETKESLEAEAALQGRSLSQVAERWIDEARAGRADLHGRLGGGGIAEALLAMADYAALVRDGVGDPQRDTAARDALIQGWAAMVFRALPFTPNSVDGVAADHARREAEALLIAFQHAILAAKDGGRASDWYMNAQSDATSSVPSAYLFSLLEQYQRLADLSDDAVTNVVALLRQAPDFAQSLSPSPDQLASAISEAWVKRAKVRARSREAEDAARALAQSVGMTSALM